MNEFETELEFAGETRPASVTWGTACGDAYIEKVEIALVVNDTYTSLGVYSPHIERRVLDVTAILSDRQALALVQQIRAACAKARAEDYDDGRMMDWEEKNRRLLAA